MEDVGESDHETLINIAYINNSDVFNLWTNENLSFSFSFSGNGHEVRAGKECDIDIDLYIGSTKIFAVDYRGCVYGTSCDSEISSTNMTVNMFKDHTEGKYNLTINGVETHFYRAGSCYWATYIKDYTSGSWSLDYSNPDEDCADLSGDLTNSWLFNVGAQTPSLYFYNEIDGRIDYVGSGTGEYSCIGDGYGCVDGFCSPETSVYCYYAATESHCNAGPTPDGWVVGSCSWEEATSSNLYGCGEVWSDLKIYNINRSLGIPQNSTIVSTSVFDSANNINSITTSAYGNLIASGTTYLFVSGDNGDNWQNLVNGVNTPIVNTGKNQKWKANINFTSLDYEPILPYISSIVMETEPSNLSNLTFDFGNDGIIDYTIDGDFTLDNGTVQVNLTDANISNSFTDTPVVGHTHATPLIVSSDSAGTLVIDIINLTYNPNPVILNYTAIQNYLTSFGSEMTLIPMILEASGLSSIVNITGLLFDYAGGNDTIEVMAHNADYSQNISRNVTYYYSRWDYEWRPESVEWIYFVPSRPNSTNVIPYGQTSTVPILNITNYGYGGKNATLSIKQDDTLNCVNTTISLDNNKSNGYLITDNWINLTNLEYLETVDIYLWADYDCSYNDWTLFQPNYYFRQCTDGGSCSTDII